LLEEIALHRGSLNRYIGSRIWFAAGDEQVSSEKSAIARTLSPARATRALPGESARDIISNIEHSTSNIKHRVLDSLARVRMIGRL
jgi:hypothetical protein